GFIDEDHKKLIDIANRVAELNHPDQDAEALKLAIRQLYDYVQYHFKREEAQMREIQYPAADSHHAIHEQIIKDMNHTLTSSQHMADMLNRFKSLMHEWVIQHIMSEDKKLREFMLLSPEVLQKSN
ncbi:MAG: hemerythrin family protein, partial [Candidatus Marinimicrobia bacterium]|nr:hemerythrin family protein [Candidatus Neomarinimicrobiota bacterium]